MKCLPVINVPEPARELLSVAELLALLMPRKVKIGGGRSTVDSLHNRSSNRYGTGPRGRPDGKRERARNLRRLAKART